MTQSPFADARRIRAELYSRFMRQYPQGAAILPPDAQEMPQVILDKAAYALSHAPAEAEPALAEWALDLRRLGFPPAEYATVAAMLAEVAGLDHDLAATLHRAAAHMTAVSERADTAGLPAAYAAQVNEVAHVELPATSLLILRAESGSEIPYAPGQRLPVMVAQRPGVWREWVSAVPANPHGHVEFHVPVEEVEKVGDVEPGALLVIGAPRGEALDIDTDELELTVDAANVAAAKAVVFALLEKPARPRVTLNFEGWSPEERYDLGVFKALARVHDWLTISA